MAEAEEVTPNKQVVVGKTLVVLGCLWFGLVLLRIPPLFSSLFLVLAWLRPPARFDEILTIVVGREYVMAATAVALGAIVWRRAVIRRWPLTLIFLSLTPSIVGITTHEFKKQAQKRREAVYEMTLRSYNEALKPGMTRKEVENYLRARNAPLEQMCCVDEAKLADRSSLDDLTKIGQEDPPWFCSENYVYIAFRFNDHERREGPGFIADRSGHAEIGDNIPLATGLPLIPGTPLRIWRGFCQPQSSSSRSG